MQMCREKTSTVNFHGILCNTERTRNIVLSSSLSAIGSRYCPILVCCLSTRASSPSSPSLIPASTKRSAPMITPAHQMNDDERQKHHPQQGELIGSGEQLRSFTFISAGARWEA